MAPYPTGRALHTHYLPRLKDISPACSGLIEEERIKMLAAQRPSPLAMRIGKWRERCAYHSMVAAEESHLPKWRPGQLRKRVTDAKRVKERKVARCNAFTAYFSSWKSMLFDDGNPPARAREQNGGAASRRTCTDDDGVEFGLHYIHPQRRATKTWLNKPARCSVSVHSDADAGHSDDNSSPRNPARTLNTASMRVTSFAPIRPTSRLPISGRRARLGSQATNMLERAASASNSRRIVPASK